FVMARAFIKVALAAVVLAGSAESAKGQSTVERTSELDRAGQQARVELVIASTTDVHGRIRGWDYFSGASDPARGLARAATILDSLRQANPGRVVLVDAGDLLQGNPLTY